MLEVRHRQCSPTSLPPRAGPITTRSGPWSPHLARASLPSDHFGRKQKHGSYPVSACPASFPFSILFHSAPSASSARNGVNQFPRHLSPHRPGVFFVLPRPCLSSALFPVHTFARRWSSPSPPTRPALRRGSPLIHLSTLENRQPVICHQTSLSLFTDQFHDETMSRHLLLLFVLLPVPSASANSLTPCAQLPHSGHLDQPHLDAACHHRAVWLQQRGAAAPGAALADLQPPSSITRNQLAYLRSIESQALASPRSRRRVEMVETVDDATRQSKAIRKEIRMLSADERRRLMAAIDAMRVSMVDNTSKSVCILV